MKWVSIRNKLTYEEILEIQELLKIKLPEDYCKTIGSINGGVLKNGYYPHPELGNIPYCRNLDLCNKAKITAMELFKIIDNGSRKYFPFGSVGNGDYFCFDFSTHKVCLYRHEKEDIIQICDNFTELMNHIIEE